MHSIPSIANVLLVCGVFWLIFSVMGFQLFGGKFYRCVDADFALVNISLVDNKAQCLANASLTKYQWTNRDINFDNALYGFLALFQTVSKFLNISKDSKARKQKHKLEITLVSEFGVSRFANKLSQLVAKSRNGPF